MARGVLVIISSPSGAGKTTLARRLLDEFDTLEFSVSYTTRPIRRGEVDGRDYFFVDEQEFEAMVGRGEFAEWALVHGNRYGTARKVVERSLQQGRDVVFDVDWQGGRKLSEQWPTDALTIFILPPDWATLEQRLRSRATDSAEVIERRLNTALDELTHHTEYAHVVINDDLEQAYELMRAIYLCRRDGESAADDAAMRVQRNRESSSRECATSLIEAGRRARS